VLGLIRLPGIEEKYPSQLSGGQQQRVALARALVIRPEVLLLDEPLSNLDAKLRESLRMEIREIQQQVGITTIFVTHDIGEAFAMSDRIAVMNAGEIVQISDPIGIYESPDNEFVGSFVGKSNQFDALVEAINGNLVEAKINDNFPMVFLKKHDNFERHQQVRLMVRPERISIAASPSGCSNSFPGVVQRAYYLGSQTHYEVNVADINIIIENYNDRKERFHRGDQVFVEWESDDCVCYS
jgi:ABC-type Fe3+/spermidine/putrescine transport system ATPase subunit